MATVATVHEWTSTEIRALREAKRMSLRDFAAHLGVSDRMVSKWEAGATPRPINQASLDTCLARCDPDVQARFAHLTADTAAGVPDRRSDELAIATEVRHPVDGKIMVPVEGSVFLSGPQNEPVWLSTFYVDVHPVSNAEYARFIAASGHEPPPHWSSDGTPPRDLDDHPVVFVSWTDADAYARWAGKALPTSQQWEKAARGTRGNAFPWGNQPTPAKCNVRENGVGSTTPGDRYQSGVSPYGVYDMCGNVWEWCADASGLDRRELKGGAWTSPFNRATPSSFNDASIKMSDDDTGFRCVASPEAFEAP